MINLSRQSDWLTGHPVCITALGLGPLVANSRTLLSALMISAAFMAVALLSVVTVSSIRKLIPLQLRWLLLLLISSTWVSVADILMQSYLYDMRVLLDIYIPLLAMNSLLLMVMERDALTMPVRAVAVSTLLVSALPVMICLACGMIREWLVYGGLFTDMTRLTGRIAPVPLSLPLFDTVAGAFIVAGCVLALVNLQSARRGIEPDRPGGETEKS